MGLMCSLRRALFQSSLMALVHLPLLTTTAPLEHSVDKLNIQTNINGGVRAQMEVLTTYA
jgi:hypothetical protein